MSKNKAKKAKVKGQRGETRRVFGLISHFLKGQRRLLLMGLLMLIIEAATAVFEPYPLARLIDFFRSSGSNLLNARHLVLFARFDVGPLSVPGVTLNSIVTVVLVLTMTMIVLTAINSLTDSIAEIYFARGGRMLGLNLRIGLYNHLQKLSLAFHNQQRTGDVLTRVTGDVTLLEEFFIASVSDIVGSVLILIGTMTFLLVKSLTVAVIAVVIVPLLSSVSNFFTKRIKAASKRARAREGDLASAAATMLASIRLIQTYGRGDYEQQRFAKHSQLAMDAALTAAKLDAGFSWVVSVLESLCTAAVLWAGLYLLGRQKISVGLLVMFVLLIDQMFKPSRRIIKEFNTIGKIYASVERIAEVLDREPAVQDLPGAAPAPSLIGHLEFRQVSFAYQAEPDAAAGGAQGNGEVPLRLALDHLSFSVRAGETVALVGHSGAGKSTVAQLVPRLYDPHDGQVLVDGHDIRQFTLDSLRQQVTMVLQETILFNGSVADNIAYGALGTSTREGIVEAARQANAHDFIESLPDGYDTELAERAANLSGGQRQRISIARAFIRDTPLLILDEPTTGLDAESTDLVLDALRLLAGGKTTLIISHDLNLIRFADRILVLEGGRISQEGTHQELLDCGGLYADLYARQFGAAAIERELQDISVSPPVSPPVARPLARMNAALLDDDADVEAEAAPARRKVFETVLMQALPLPASRQEFERMTMTHQAAPRPPTAPPRPPTAPPLPPQPTAPPLPPQPTAPPLPPQPPGASQRQPPPAAQQPAPASAPAPAPSEARSPLLPPATPPAPAPPRRAASTPPEPPPPVAKAAADEVPVALLPTERVPAVKPPPKPKTAKPPPAAPPKPKPKPKPKPEPQAPEAPAPPADDAGGPPTVLAELAAETGTSTATGTVTAAAPWNRVMLDPLRSPALALELPGLREVLDGTAMARRLRELLADGYALERCRAGKALYVPGEGCSVRYQVELRETATGRRFERLVGGRLFSDGDAATAFLRERLAPLVERAAGRTELEAFARPIARVAPLRLVLHAFPLDGDLPTLVDATDPAGMTARLGDSLHTPQGGRLVAERCAVELVQYARRDRCVLRFRVGGHLIRTHQQSDRVLYGKVYGGSQGQGEQVGPVTATLREHVLGGHGIRFAVPAFEGYLSELSLALFEAIPGTPQVASLLRAQAGAPAGSGSDGHDAAGRRQGSGRALLSAIQVCGRIGAALHTSGIALGGRRTFADDLTAVRADLEAAARRCPPLAKLLGAHLDRAELAAASTDEAPPVFSHGDFTPSQVLFAGPVHGLIDLDTACQAEPALDLGQFLAYFEVLRRKADLAADRPPSPADELRDAFLNAYAAADGVNLDRDGLLQRASAYQTVSLTRMALRSWLQLKVARLENVLNVLEQR